ncbi:hypothetical protein Droror1_Dr00014617 [Drosera rotundifolia]
MAQHHLDSHVVEIPIDHDKSMTIVEDPIAVLQRHPLMEISRSPGHLLLLKLWQREEDLLSRRMAVKETRMDSFRANIFQLSCLLLLFHGFFFTILFSSSSSAKDERKCKKWLIPSFLSLITCLVVVFLVQVDLFRCRKVSRQLRKEREDSRALTRCVQELRMKGESFDLNKEPLIGKKMKSSSVEVKWRPVSWFRDNFVTIGLVVFAGLMFPVPKLIVCYY